MSLGVCMSSDNAKRSEKLPQLEWQSELDSMLEDTDDRLTHPRRRATDRQRQSNVEGSGDRRLSPEIMDEIAWRVAEELRRRQEVSVAAAPQAAPIAPSQPAPAGAPARPRPPVQSRPVTPPVKDEPLRPGKMLMIRYRMPALPWPFRLLQRRRRQHPLTTVKLRA